jgi:hypothetical protein
MQKNYGKHRGKKLGSRAKEFHGSKAETRRRAFEEREAMRMAMVLKRRLRGGRREDGPT